MLASQRVLTSRADDAASTATSAALAFSILCFELNLPQQLELLIAFFENNSKKYILNIV
jgi:hypothetical protein